MLSLVLSLVTSKLERLCVLLHIADDLFNVRLHILHLLVFLRMERWVLLNFVGVVLVSTILIDWLHVSILSDQGLFLCFLLFLKEFRTIAVLVNARCPIVSFKEAVDVNQGEVCNTLPVNSFLVVEPSRLREGCFPKVKNDELRTKSMTLRNIMPSCVAFI